MKKQEAILQELQDILGEKTDWGDYPKTDLPEGYFDVLPARIMASLDKANARELEDAEAILPKAKTGPYEVPANYFEELPASIMARLDTEQPAAKVVNIKRNRQGWKYAAAAGVAALIISTIMLFSPHQKQTIEEQLNHIPDQAIEAYLQNTSDAFDQESIFKNVNVNSKSILSTVDNQLSPEAIKRYLQENGDLNNVSLKN